MRALLLPVLASLAFASPALADTRAEVRGGLISIDGTGEPVLGAAAGIDVSVAPLVFVGAELSVDKADFGGGQTMVGLSGRIGAALPSGTKLYAIAGYNSEFCTNCDDRLNAGGGVQQRVLGPLYLKAEYRHYFAGSGTLATDSVVAGVGVSF